MSYRFVMTGIGGVWNYGCEAIVRSTFDMLTETFPQCQVGLISRSPNYDLKALSDIPIDVIPVRPRWSPHRITGKLLRTLRLPQPFFFSANPLAFRRASCVLSIGGDIYTPHSRGIPWYLLIEEEKLLEMGCPIVLWGATVGPFPNGTVESERMCAYLERVRLITARESRTMGYLGDLGLTDNVRLVSDPAFVLRPEKFDCNHLFPKNKGEAMIGLNLSPLLGDYYKKEKDGTIVELAVDCVESLLGSLPVSVSLIPHVVATSEQDNDFLLLERVAEQIGNADGRLALVPADLGVCKTKYYLSKCDVVVAARMHCAIGALSSLTPTICISYSMKSIGVLGDLFDSDRWIIPLGKLSGATLIERVRDLLNQRQSVKNHLEKVVPSFQDKAREAARALKDVL